MEAAANGVPAPKSPKSLALEKMEGLVRQMQSHESGVPVRGQKLFLTTIPSAFMGYDLIEWLMQNVPMEESVEALHLASLLCQHGYFFPVGDAKTLQVKDDSSLYRFQTPYYWPSQNHVPDSTDYAIYIHKKMVKAKQKNVLEEYELEAYNQMKKTLASKWDFVVMQADEQLKMAKDRKKGDKIVSESQERAYWRVYRPPPGFTNSLEAPPVPDHSRRLATRQSYPKLCTELEVMQTCLVRSRSKVSQVAECLIASFETYLEFDPLLTPVQPSNPWLSDDPAYLELNWPLVDCPTERRVRRWAINITELVSDPTGLQEMTNCMRKEFSHENIRFWAAVHRLKKAPLASVREQVEAIYAEFLRPGAPCEINIDGKTLEKTQELMKNPTRFTMDYAAEHIYEILLKKDCYPRFLRSDHYKNLQTNAANPTSKKRFFTFGATGKKKMSSVIPPNAGQLVTGPGRHGADDPAAATCSRPDTDQAAGKEDAGIFLGDDLGAVASTLKPAVSAGSVCQGPTSTAVTAVSSAGPPAMTTSTFDTGRSAPADAASARPAPPMPPQPTAPATGSEKPAVTDQVCATVPTPARSSVARQGSGQPPRSPAPLAQMAPSCVDSVVSSQSVAATAAAAAASEPAGLGASQSGGQQPHLSPPPEPGQPPPCQPEPGQPPQPPWQGLPISPPAQFQDASAPASAPLPTIAEGTEPGLPPASPAERRSTRRKHHRTSPAAAAAAASESTSVDVGEPARDRRRERRPRGPGRAYRPPETADATARCESRRKTSGERRAARRDEGHADADGRTSSPKKWNVVAPSEAQQVPQKMEDATVCPWENEESCKMDTPFVKTYATLGYL